jgi:transposase-like protein
VFFDALRVKVRDESVVRNKAVHVALGVRADGTKEVLGLWIEQNEGGARQGSVRAADGMRAEGRSSGCGS